MTHASATAGWVEQDGLQLGGGHLEAADLDQLLDAVDDREPAVAVDGRDVPRAQPAVRDRRGGGRVVAQVALHDLRASHEQLPRFPLLHLLAGGDVDDARFCPGHERADAARVAAGASNGVMCVTGLASVIP